MGSKTGLTATGCTGTATWKIGDTGDMLAVMWSIPFDQNWYQLLSNTFERQILMSVTHLSSCGESFLNRIGNPDSWNGLACLYSLISPIYIIYDDLIYERYSNWCAIGIMPVQEDTSDLWEKMYYGPEVNFTREEYYDRIPR